jgi:quinoprotein glucose dehydrogenase
MQTFRAAFAAAVLAATPALAQEYEVETLAEGLDRPWGMVFLPGGSDLLITGKTGHLMLWQAASGEVVEIAGAPEVDSRGQGGLLDVELAPDYAETGLVYLSWSAAVEGGGTTTHLGRGRLDLEAGRLADLEVLFRVSPAVDSQAHYGGRIAVQDGHVFLGTGDRNFKDFGPGHIAQDLSSENGAVIRLTLDGQVPADNPFVGVEGASPAIWSYGHRNVQAMAPNPWTGALWLGEHGEAGGDEINVVQRGGNYGWPLAAFGVDYRTGAAFAAGHEPGDGFVAPAFHWGPGREDHFPPSGMAWYDGDAFPEWQGRLLVGNLFHRYLGLFDVDGDTASAPERLLEGEGLRIRDVAVGPEDGFIYVIADGEDAPLLRLTPAGERG